MKTTLTTAESARLIKLGIDPKMASKSQSCIQPYEGVRGIVRLPQSRPIFTLTDLLAILPPVIVADTIMGNGSKCAMTITFNEEYYEWIVGYFGVGMPVNPNNPRDRIGKSEELIDSLYSLLVWAINNNHINLKEEKE